MDWHHRPSKVLITGKSGSGKTTLWLSRLTRSSARRVFIFDPELETAHKLRLTPARTDRDLVRAACLDQFIVFDPAEMFRGDFPAGFDAFCRWCFEVSGTIPGLKLLACDELHRYTGLGQVGIGPGLRDVLDLGRRYKLDLLACAQSVNKVNDAIRMQLTDVITFQHTEPLCLQWLDELSFSAEAVVALPCPGGYIHRNLRDGTEKVHWPDAARGRSPARLAGGQQA